MNADLSTAKYLRRLELENSYIEPNFRLPSSLEVLVCRDCIFTRLSSISIQPPSSLFQKPQQNFEALANLQCLELDSTIVRLPPVFTVLPASLGPILTKLAINSDVMETTALMTSFEAGGLSNLTYLGLYGLNMNNEHIQRITSKCPMLEYVEFRGLMITGVAVKELCLNTAVKTLRLSCCDKVSADAIEWARAKGVSVIVNVSGAHACGRRVRYG